MTVEDGLTFDDLPFDGADVVIDESVSSAADLLSRFDKGLDFPYFGMNWNSLEECLSDLTWISRRDVVVDHRALPSLAVDDMELYLKVLAAAVQNRSGCTPSLVVRFKTIDRERVLDLLNRPHRPVPGRGSEG